MGNWNPIKYELIAMYIIMAVVSLGLFNLFIYLIYGTTYSEWVKMGEIDV